MAYKLWWQIFHILIYVIHVWIRIEIYNILWHLSSIGIIRFVSPNNLSSFMMLFSDHILVSQCLKWKYMIVYEVDDTAECHVCIGELSCCKYRYRKRWDWVFALISRARLGFFQSKFRVNKFIHFGLFCILKLLKRFCYAEKIICKVLKHIYAKEEKYYEKKKIQTNWFVPGLNSVLSLVEKWSKVEILIRIIFMNIV